MGQATGPLSTAGMAFLVVIGFALVMYPVVRAARKSAVVLGCAAGLAALAVLVAAGPSVGWRSFPAAASSAIGALLGVLVVVFLFFSRAHWLMLIPRDGRFVRDFDVQPVIRLRDVLQMGALMEDRGRAFYAQLASRASSPDIRSLCEELARREAQHQALIERTLGRWLTVPMGKSTLALLDQEMRVRGIFQTAPPANAPVDAMLRYAIEQERVMEHFYRDFEQDFPDAWKRMHLQELVMEERSHASRLEILLARHPVAAVSAHTPRG
ncbi:MAG TPA: ferritin family protein [bacterium]